MTSSTKPLKAYSVYEWHENPGDGIGIVFAHTAQEARLLAWQGHTDRGSHIEAESYIDLRAKRLPWADQYATAPRIPLQAYFEHGWSWGCRVCDRLVWMDDIGAIRGEAVFCIPHAAHGDYAIPDWVRKGETDD